MTTMTRLKEKLGRQVAATADEERDVATKTTPANGKPERLVKAKTEATSDTPEATNEHGFEVYPKKQPKKKQPKPFEGTLDF